MLASTFAGSVAWMAVAVVLVFVAMFLAAAEMAVSRINVVKAEALAADKGRAGRALAKLVSEPERYLNPVLLLATICQIAQAFLFAIVAHRLWHGWGVWAAFGLDVVVVFVLAEALPKTWAVLNPDRVGLPVASLGRLLPLRLASRSLLGLSNVLAPGKGLQKGPFVSERELLGIVDAAVDDDVIEHEERELIESVIEFGDTVAREIMVPRPDMITVGAGASITGALDRAIEHGFSRVPVVNEGIDDVVGVAYAKDLMRAEREGHGADIVTTVVRPARFVPETKPVARLMREMQAETFHLALLVDEYGGIAGLVTLEDCLEELVGDIVDEYDREDAEVERMPDGVLRLDGGMAIGDVNDLLSLELPDDDWDTIGGFVFGTLGHVPEAGEHVDREGFRFTADKVDGRRIALVRVAPLHDDERSWIERALEGDDEPANGRH